MLKRQVQSGHLTVHNKVLYGETPAQASPRGGGNGNCLGGERERKGNKITPWNEEKEKYAIRKTPRPPNVLAV